MCPNCTANRLTQTFTDREPSLTDKHSSANLDKKTTPAPGLTYCLCKMHEEVGRKQGPPSGRLILQLISLRLQKVLHSLCMRCGLHTRLRNGAGSPRGALLFACEPGTPASPQKKQHSVGLNSTSQRFHTQRNGQCTIHSNKGTQPVKTAQKCTVFKKQSLQQYNSSAYKKAALAAVSLSNAVRSFK